MCTSVYHNNMYITGMFWMLWMYGYDFIRVLSVYHNNVLDALDVWL